VRRLLFGSAGAWGQCAPASPGRRFCAAPPTSSLGARMQCTRAALILAAIFLFSAAVLGAEKGWFGLAVSVDVDGLSLNPTLRTITVQKVFASSPAASVGMAPGDTLVEVEGIVVAGTKADIIKTAMQKSVGQTLHLKIRRSTADIREVALVAVPKPAGQ
jgi:predicted metalloprotease with PDZ domain